MRSIFNYIRVHTKEVTKTQNWTKSDGWTGLWSVLSNVYIHYVTVTELSRMVSYSPLLKFLLYDYFSEMGIYTFYGHKLYNNIFFCIFN